MYDARVARIAALYRAGSSTDSPRPPHVHTPLQNQQRTSLWRAELDRSIAELERRRKPR